MEDDAGGNAGVALRPAKKARDDGVPLNNPPRKYGQNSHVDAASDGRGKRTVCTSCPNVPDAHEDMREWGYAARERNLRASHEGDSSIV